MKTMKMLTALAATMAAMPAVAHEVWVERDASGAVEIPKLAGQDVASVVHISTLTFVR